MNIVVIYLISFLFSMIPSMINRTLYQFKLFKEGYNYSKISYGDSAHLLSKIIVSLIPVLNIKFGIEEIIKLLNFKSNYSEYKLNLLINEEIYNEKKHDKEDELKDILYTFADALNLDEEGRKEFDKILEISRLYEYLIDKDFKINKEYENMSLDSKLEYLRNKKIEIDKKEIDMNQEIANLSMYLFECDIEFDDSYNQMSNVEKLKYLKNKKFELDSKKEKNFDKKKVEEKINYLKKEKEKIMTTDENEIIKKLERK